jgi:hypothetical protein
MGNLFELNPLNFYGVLSSKGDVGDREIKLSLGTSPNIIASDYNLLMTKRESEN